MTSIIIAFSSGLALGLLASILYSTSSKQSPLSPIQLLRIHLNLTRLKRRLHQSKRQP